MAKTDLVESTWLHDRVVGNGVVRVNLGSCTRTLNLPRSTPRARGGNISCVTFIVKRNRKSVSKLIQYDECLDD